MVGENIATGWLKHTIVHNLLYGVKIYHKQFGL